MIEISNQRCATGDKPFRGWLCSNCNIALGLAGDNPEGVRRLLEYITRAQAMLDLRQLLE
jgi:hypothetical protein